MSVIHGRHGAIKMGSGNQPVQMQSWTLRDDRDEEEITPLANDDPSANAPAITSWGVDSLTEWGGTISCHMDDSTEPLDVKDSVSAIFYWQSVNRSLTLTIKILSVEVKVDRNEYETVNYEFTGSGDGVWDWTT